MDKVHSELPSKSKEMCLSQRAGIDWNKKVITVQYILIPTGRTAHIWSQPSTKGSTWPSHCRVANQADFLTSVDDAQSNSSDRCGDSRPCTSSCCSHLSYDIIRCSGISVVHYAECRLHLLVAAQPLTRMMQAANTHWGIHFGVESSW